MQGYHPLMSSSVVLSVVIPLYNEEKKIVCSLPLVDHELDAIERRRGILCELILVNDGSKDKTVEAIRATSAFHDTKLINLSHNRGKGYALKQGFMQARGDFILFMDADLSTPLAFLEQFLQMADSLTILIGNRRMVSGSIQVRQHIIRRCLGTCFIIIANAILGAGVSDFTCGFKMFPSGIGKKIFRNLTVARWGFDAEIIFLARRFGMSIREVPVIWSHDKETKVRLMRDVVGTLCDLCKIRINALGSAYERF